MARVEARIRALEGALVIGALVMIGRAGYLQLVKGGEYAKVAAAHRTETIVLEAPRGRILDRREDVLATSLERYRINVAGEQVRDLDGLLAVYRRDVGFRSDRLQTALRGKDNFYAHGPFTAGQVRRLRQYDGVYLEPIYRREYPSGRLARPLIGSLKPDVSEGGTGLERFLDSLLTGQPGRAVLIRDRRGKTYESPGRVTRQPVRGHDVVLTIDRELQSIAEAELKQVFDSLNPRAGDILFLDPRTGQVLAAASRTAATKGGEQLATASYFMDTFEPGSTAKPFTAAALLELGRVDNSDAVTGEDGAWHLDGRPRPVTDVHPVKGPISLAIAIEKSSNVAMGKFSLLLKPTEQFDFLRSFGLATPTGIEFPSEAAGSLPAPNRWKPALEGVSAAMGYAITVTPLQLAAAYGAIANDGILMAPTLVLEVRDASGVVRYRHQPTQLRRVVSSEVAATIRGFLKDASGAGGTGDRSQVKGTVLGKTGTSRLVVDGRYTDRHSAFFAAIYPAQDPQLVVVVRIEDPSGRYYGGEVAAPIVRSMLTQALTARANALDRAPLAEDRVERAPARAGTGATGSGSRLRSSVSFPLPADQKKETLGVVPDVGGMTPRQAAAILNRRGFRVSLDGAGVVRRTRPEAGDSLRIGRVVMVVATRSTPP